MGSSPPSSPGEAILEQKGLAFAHCEVLTNVKFGSKLERIEARSGIEGAFLSCHSLERITIPLKGDLRTANDTFQECHNLKYVDLVEGAMHHDTIAALQLEDWRDDMKKEIDSINLILPYKDAGRWNFDNSTSGEKAQAIRT